MCQFQHGLGKFVGIKCFRKETSLSVINDQIHGAHMISDHRKAELKGFHNHHRPAFPSGWKKENRRIQIILLRLIGISYKMDTLLQMTLLRVCPDLVKKISVSNDIKLPLRILFTKLFKGFHHQIQSFGIYETGRHKKTFGFHIALLFTDKASGIDFYFTIYSKLLHIVALIIITQHNVAVQIWQILLKKVLLLPENDRLHMKISVIAVMLPTDGCGFQPGRDHGKSQA